MDQYTIMRAMKQSEWRDKVAENSVPGEDVIESMKQYNRACRINDQEARSSNTD